MDKFPKPIDFTSIEDEEELQRLMELQNSAMSLWLKGQKGAIEDKFRQYHRRFIDEGIYNRFHGAFYAVLKKLDDDKEFYDNIGDYKEGNNPYCFFTVNLRPEKATESSLIEFKTEFDTWLEKTTYMKDAQYIYSLEQRAEGDEPVHGLHVHILFEKLKHSPSKLQRAFNNKFFDKWVATHAALDYKYISTQKLQEKIAYIMGKKEKSKMPKVLRDIKMKEAYKIKLYENKGFDEIIKWLSE